MIDRARKGYQASWLPVWRLGQVFIRSAYGKRRDAGSNWICYVSCRYLDPEFECVSDCEKLVIAGGTFPRRAMPKTFRSPHDFDTKWIANLRESVSIHVAANHQDQSHTTLNYGGFGNQTARCRMWGSLPKDVNFDFLLGRVSRWRQGSTLPLHHRDQLFQLLRLKPYRSWLLHRPCSWIHRQPSMVSWVLQQLAYRKHVLWRYCPRKVLWWAIDFGEVVVECSAYTIEESVSSTL